MYGGHPPYSFPVFQSKLEQFDATQQSIQDLSRWLISHKDHVDEIVHMWSTEYYKVPTDRKLTFLYLANDIMQTSRRYTTSFIERFTTVLPKAVNTLMRESDTIIQGKVNRMIGIWKDRQVLPPKSMEEIISLPPVDLNKITSPTPIAVTKPTAPVAKNGSPQVPQPSQPAQKLPRSLEKIVRLHTKLQDQEAANLLAEDNLTLSSKASIFPWTPQSKHRLNSENSLEMLADVRKTLSAANDLKERVEKDLERRAELVTLINQLQGKQEVILASNISKLQDCLAFLENINAAHSDIEDYTKNMTGFKRFIGNYNNTNVPDFKRPKVNSPPPPLPEPARHPSYPPPLPLSQVPSSYRPISKPPPAI